MTPPFLVNQNQSKEKQFEKLLVRVRVYRAGNGFTQSEMAKKLGLSLRTYQRVEQGIAPLDIETLYSLCEVFDIPYKNIAGPEYKKADLPNVQFYSNLSEVPNLDPKMVESFKGIIDGLYKGVNEEKENLADLHKIKVFKDSSLPAYYSDPKWTWVNKSLRKDFDPSLKGRVSVMRNMSDFEFIIKVWELCYNSPKRVYTCQTIYEKEGTPISEVNTLNLFTLHEGFPFTIGTILGTKNLN